MVWLCSAWSSDERRGDSVVGLGQARPALVYPEVCQLCHDESAQPADGYVGTDCLEKMKPIEAPFCRRCGQPFEGEITGEFECTNCREMKLRFKSPAA